MLRNYLLVAWKVLLRRRFFTFVSLFGVAVTMMVLLVAAALIDHTLAPHPPEIHADRTLGIYVMALKGPHLSDSGPCGYGFLSRFRSMTELPGVEAISIVSGAQTAVSYLGERRIESQLRRTDGAFWRMMRFEFLEGGPFTDGDEKNGNFVAIINRATRDRFFAGAPAFGRSLEVDGQRFRVLGVVENVPLNRVVTSADLWVPISTSKSSSYKSEWRGTFSALFLARSRKDFPQIKAEVARRVRLATADIPNPKDYNEILTGADTLFERVSREALSESLRRPEVGRMALILATLVLLFMSLPAVNLININLSRILDRASEIGVRKAFGASSWTLVGQFVVENVVLTLLGALFGLALAAGALAAVNASGLVAYSHFSLNGRVFLAGLGLALFFGLLSGAYPAWRMSRLHPADALRGRVA